MLILVIFTSLLLWSLCVHRYVFSSHLMRLELGLFCFQMLFSFCCPYASGSNSKHFFITTQNLLNQFGYLSSFNSSFKHTPHLNIFHPAIGTTYRCPSWLFLSNALMCTWVFLILAFFLSPEGTFYFLAFYFLFHFLWHHSLFKV